ncbi:MAG: hypothetical protein Q7T07_00170 [Burkholderiaceae bacterium]|nr:hypothetical protein [Burkholderiaceae bacterium]
MASFRLAATLVVTKDHNDRQILVCLPCPTQAFCALANVTSQYNKVGFPRIVSEFEWLALQMNVTVDEGLHVDMASFKAAIERVSFGR